MSGSERIVLYYVSDTCQKHCITALDEFNPVIFTDFDELVESFNNKPAAVVLIEVGKNIQKQELQKLRAQIEKNNKLATHCIYITTNKEQENSLEKVDYFPLSSISQQYGYKILQNHIRKILLNKNLNQQANEVKSELNEVQQELEDITNTMLVLQNDNAKLMDINRFLQHSFFCPNIQSLCEQLFSVLHSFGTSATILIHSDKHDEFIADNTTKKINKDVLLLLKDESRIFQFGNDRAVFNWESASLLVTKVGEDIDNIAMLMDGFEIGFNAIISVEEFNNVLLNYREASQKLNADVTKVVEDLASDINGKLSKFGKDGLLSIEQEDELLNLAEESTLKVDQLFEASLKIDEELNKVMDKMRSEKEDASSTTVEEDTIDFF
ncbi:MAG: hypothetical protein HQL46_10235 [Gammaproteobacteria bacterium]|nr:hypothetical protein [Gammaproteobacteria bacterium]